MRRITLCTLILGFLLSGFAMAEKEKPKFDTNTLYFEKVTTQPGQHFAVEVYVFNIDSVAGMQVPTFFRSDSIDLYCDSVSLINSRCDYMMMKDIKLPEEDGDKVVYFSFLNTFDPNAYIDPLAPGDGLVATMYFTAPEDCKEGAVSLVRGMIPHPQISFVFTMWDALGAALDYEFEESEIVIKKQDTVKKSSEIKEGEGK